MEITQVTCGVFDLTMGIQMGTRFKKPTIKEINDYCIERKNNIDAENFYYFYESKDWMIGKSKMKNWKAAIITWEKRNKSTPMQSKNYQPVYVDQEEHKETPRADDKTAKNQLSLIRGSLGRAK